MDREIDVKPQALGPTRAKMVAASRALANSGHHSPHAVVDSSATRWMKIGRTTGHFRPTSPKRGVRPSVSGAHQCTSRVLIRAHLASRGEVERLISLNLSRERRVRPRESTARPSAGIHGISPVSSGLATPSGIGVTHQAMTSSSSSSTGGPRGGVGIGVWVDSPTASRNLATTNGSVSTARTL